MDYSTQFFCSGHILLSPTMPGTSIFFQPATRVQVREDGQASPPELGQLHLYHCCGYLKGPAHSPGVLQPTLPIWLTTPKSHVAPQQGLLGTQMAGPARDPGLCQLPFLHGWCWLGAAAPSLGALCLDLPSCLSFFIG